MAVVPLIENPPWTRHVSPDTAPDDAGTVLEARWEKLIDFQWTPVKPTDLLQLTATEAQAWLVVHFLLASDDFRKRYHLHSSRKGTLLRLRKYLNDTLCD